MSTIAITCTKLWAQVAKLLFVANIKFTDLHSFGIVMDQEFPRLFDAAF